MVIGGDPVGDRHIWWNFVSSSKDLIVKPGSIGRKDDSMAFPATPSSLHRPTNRNAGLLLFNTASFKLKKDQDDEPYCPNRLPDS